MKEFTRILQSTQNLQKKIIIWMKPSDSIAHQDQPVSLNLFRWGEQTEGVVQKGRVSVQKSAEGNIP
jgi:hypothetical protein